MAPSASPREQLLTFTVGRQGYALDADIVREVALMPHLARVPHAPSALLGLANIRGSVVPIVSMARLLNQPDGTSARVILVHEGELLGLAVDEASQVIPSGQKGSLQQVDVAQLMARIMPASVQPRSRTASAVLLQEAVDRSEVIRLVTFAIGDQELALPLASVDQVLMLPQDIAVLPDADEVVVGSAAVRGAVLPLLSLAALLALPASRAGSRTRVLVVRIGSQRIGLCVDEMRSIMRMSETNIDPLPQALKRGSAEARIAAMCRLGDGARLVSILSAEQLLREDITERILQVSSAENDAMAQEPERATEQFLLFRIGSEEFGIPIGAVEEVTRLPGRLTRLPKAPSFVQGVMNLRGKVIPVIDQGKRFGAPPTSSARRRVIVTRIGDLTAGFVVDAVSEVVRLDAGALQDAPNLGSEETRVFERVANLSDKQGIVLIVSPSELLGRAERDLLLEIGRKGAKAAS